MNAPEGAAGPMFRDAAQAGRVARALLVVARTDDLWTEEGPTERARRLRREPKGALTKGEAVTPRAAWSVRKLSAHTPGRSASLWEVLRYAPRVFLGRLGRLLDALSLEEDGESWAAVDAWLAVQYGGQTIE